MQPYVSPAVVFYRSCGELGRGGQDCHNHSVPVHHSHVLWFEGRIHAVSVSPVKKQRQYLTDTETEEVQKEVSYEAVFNTMS